MPGIRVPRQLLRETVSVQAYLGSGPRGPMWDTASERRAAMQNTQKLEVSRGDRLVINDVVMITRPEDGPLAPESRVEWLGLAYRVRSSFAYPDSRRPTHYETNLTRLET